MTNSTAPLFMETVERLGAGYLFGLTDENDPLRAGSWAQARTRSLSESRTDPLTGSRAELPGPRAELSESGAEATERLRLVAARSGEPADLRDYLNALATAVPSMSPDTCRFVADLLGVGVAPAFRHSAVPHQL